MPTINFDPIHSPFLTHPPSLPLNFVPLPLMTYQVCVAHALTGMGLWPGGCLT